MFKTRKKVTFLENEIKQIIQNAENLRREGFSRSKSFLIGVLSGLVEPISAILGSLLVLKINHILSFILAFAAGAMIFVTILELIPESQSDEKKDLMALLLIIGFSTMMILDVLLG